MQKKIVLLSLVIFCYSSNAQAYTLPAFGLGLSSFLDGGPLRQIPGWYGQLFNQYYTTHKFLDASGKLLLGIPSPRYDLWATDLQLIYLSTKDFLGLGTMGFDITLPIALYSRIGKNLLGVTSTGSGIGDLVLGVYAQGQAIWKNDKPFYVQRLELLVSIPTGKYTHSVLTISPGHGDVVINPYWAATLYFTPGFSASWRLNYAWASTDHKTHVKPGDAIYLNYALEVAMRKNFFIGLNGYYLQQIKESTLEGITIADSKERVLAIGPGFLWALEKHFAFVIVGNLFFEMDVRNRSQGIKAVLRILKHF